MSGTLNQTAIDDLHDVWNGVAAEWERADKRVSQVLHASRPVLSHWNILHIYRLQLSLKQRPENFLQGTSSTPESQNAVLVSRYQGEYR